MKTSDLISFLFPRVQHFNTGLCNEPISSQLGWISQDDVKRRKKGNVKMCLFYKIWELCTFFYSSFIKMIEESTFKLPIFKMFGERRFKLSLYLQKSHWIHWSHNRKLHLCSRRTCWCSSDVWSKWEFHFTSLTTSDSSLFVQEDSK